MKVSDLPHQRLSNQHISEPTFQKPGEVVRWLGAVQAQDYAGAKWAVALRLNGATDAKVEQAFASGEILRTHVMRPTWHFVAPEDIRWMLELTAPRVHAANCYQYRRLELSRAIFKRTNAVVTKALRDGRQLTRAELGSVLRQAGIAADDLRLTYLVLAAELDGVICSGARRAKQFTYTLLDERAPAVKTLTRDEALAELTRRYFVSHGPATEADFIWWSGLTRTDVRSGIEMVKRQLEHAVIDGKAYWSAESMPRSKNSRQAAFLLPNFDEYIVGYTDRGSIFDELHNNQLDARRNPLFQHTIVMHGQIAGTWKRILKKDTVIIEFNPFTPVTNAERAAMRVAAEKYADFLELEASLAKQPAGPKRSVSKL
jgi:hypothetical protein